VIEQPFNPLIDNKSKILILGSFPSVKSRAEAFYYMHPNNRFWMVLSAIYQEDFLGADIQHKKELLSKHHIALYDVVESCQIIGSKDSSITPVKIADIPYLIRDTQVDRIFLNGRKAESIFYENFPRLKSMAHYLPSTSPANAQFDLDKLIHFWRVIKS
jgi:hypoxanthine-DNA glycosylase